MILAFVGVLLLLQPDFGTLGLIVIIAVSVYFFSGAPAKHLLILFVIFGIALGSLAFVSPYRFNRIKTFLDPTTDTLGSSYHINQALITIGSGGVWGVGYGNSQQKISHLPEPVGDSIFAVLVEEFGFVGGISLILMFLVLLGLLIHIARKSRDDFGRLFVLGMAVWVVGQAFINIGAISGLVPLTGLPLPFISFGSSSLVSILAGMGIATSVSRYS
ncbi:MAG: FtsW/RodA/SpoVE family cell cycle protein [Parcubacteria group bacterium]